MTDEEKECVKLWLNNPEMEFEVRGSRYGASTPGWHRLRIERISIGEFPFQSIASEWQHIRRIPEPKPVEMRYMTPLEAGDFALEHYKDIEVAFKGDDEIVYEDDEGWSHALAFNYDNPEDLKYRYRGQTEVHEFKVPVKPTEGLGTGPTWDGP